MNHPTIKRFIVDGFDAIHADTGALALTLLPELGGKISRLRDMRSGRAWLWRNPRLAYQRMPHGSSYVLHADSGGWDECFPTVGACPVRRQETDVTLTDHGELWYQPWQHQLYERAGAVTLAGSVMGRQFPYELARDITVPPDGAEVQLRYRLCHRGDKPFPYLWSSHPLLNVQDGTTLEVPGVSRAMVAEVHGRDDIRVNDAIGWPLDSNDGAYHFASNRGWAVKLFADLGAEGVMRLTDPQRGERLELRVSPREVPQVGIWINSGGWAPPGKRPYDNLALEPCIGAPDRLDLALTQTRLASILLPGTERVWSVTVTLRE